MVEFNKICGAILETNKYNENFIKCSSCKQRTSLFWLFNSYHENNKVVKGYYGCNCCGRAIIIERNIAEDEQEDE